MIHKREILYRGKRIDGKEWVEGYPFDDGIVGSNRMFVGGLVIEDYKGTADDDHIITGSDLQEVIPDTVCEYTGLTDRNGKKIFEGDIVGIEDEEDDAIFVVKWDADTARFVMDTDGCTVDFDNYNGYDCEVIGNIYDDPELVEGKA